METFLLDGLLQDSSGFIGAVFLFMVEIISFAGFFILVFALLQGFIGDKWHYNEFLLVIIIFVVVGPMPGIQFITQGAPPELLSYFTSLP
ncbi:MAG TPA: hypothetical protein VKK79_15370 [Candidatus Lokiarchaeia archaeon]|nr:hypothetical protein [Candidatus Lokiarchaeia archaeon]